MWLGAVSSVARLRARVCDSSVIFSLDLGPEGGLKSKASSTENSLVGDQWGSGGRRSPNDQRRSGGSSSPNDQQGSGGKSSPNDQWGSGGSRSPNDQRGSGGRSSPNDQPDVGTIFSSSVLTPPRTDPLHRRARGVELDRDRAGSDSRKARGEVVNGRTGEAREPATGVSATKSDITLSSSNSGVSSTGKVKAYRRGNLLKQSDFDGDSLDLSQTLPPRRPLKAPSATEAADSKASSVQKPLGQE